MTTVYIDMDGVVCDWYKAVEGKEFSHEWFKEFIMADGFLYLPEFPEACRLLSSMTRENHIFGYDERYVFLSSCGGAEEHVAKKARDDKRMWLNEHGFSHVDLICVKHKGLKKDFASPTSILIDDTPANISDFTENKGYGIIVDSTKGFEFHHTENVFKALGKIEFLLANGYYTG